MKTKSPQVSVIQDKTKKKSDGTIPLFIVVCWKGTRAKEGCHLSMTEKNFKAGQWKKSLRKRLNEIDDRIDELLSTQKPFTASDCLSKTNVKSPVKILSEMASIKKLGEGTVEGYRIALHSLQKYFGEDFTLNELSLHQVQGFARHTRVNPTTMCGYLKRLHSLLQFAYEKGYVKSNVMSGWKFKSDGYKATDKPKTRTAADITKYISIYESTSDEGLGIWLSGFYFNGLALTDLISVDWPNVKQSLIKGSRYFETTVFRKKTKEVAHVVTPVIPLTERLHGFLCSRPWNGYSVSQYSDRINRLLKKTDKTLTYYQCRHTFASQLVKNKIPLNTIASMLGRSINGISVYIERITESESLASAAEMLRWVEIPDTPPDDFYS